MAVGGRQVGAVWAAAVLVVALSATVPALAHAEAGLTAESRPATIVDGTTVPSCGWPTAVELYASNNRCTGVYIGGRVVLTAAHCFPRGFAIPTPCSTSADCPSMGEFDNAIDLECSPSGEACIDDDEELSNAVRYARFGENFPKHDDVTDGHIRRAVPVAYCRTWNDEDYWGGGQTSATGDFAYCILAADPNVQVVPVMMHCEADQFLAEDTVMTAVGFGREEASDPNTSGRKRFATKPLPSGEAALSSQISMGASGWTPGKPTHGDSGGPLFVQLPDDTWRVVGIAINSVDTYNTVWSRMDWLSEDPNADMNAILPCHDTDGTWNPGPSCGGFPEEPDVGFGAWQKSPACEDPNVGGASQTCVMLKLGPEPKLAAPEALPGQASDVAGPEQARGCRTGGGPPVGFRSLLLLVLLIRRTRDEHS